MFRYAKDDWITYTDTGEQVIRSYSGALTDDSSYLDALTYQAQQIFAHEKNITVFVSGGIDSQSAAMGFVHARLPVKYVHVNFSYDDEANHMERFFAFDFAGRNGIELTEFNYCMNRSRLADLVERENYFNTSAGLGGMIQMDCYRQYRETHPDETMVIGIGNFLFTRTDRTCRGLIPALTRGQARGFDYNLFLPFNYYTPRICQYLERRHREDEALQFFAKYEPKHLAYSDLGLPLRPKLSSCEQLHGIDKYRDLTVIDFGSCQNYHIYPISGARLVAEKLGITDQDIVTEKHRLIAEASGCYSELYRFETTIDERHLG